VKISFNWLRELVELHEVEVSEDPLEQTHGATFARPDLTAQDDSDAGAFGRMLHRERVPLQEVAVVLVMACADDIAQMRESCT